MLGDGVGTDDGVIPAVVYSVVSVNDVGLSARGVESQDEHFAYVASHHQGGLVDLVGPLDEQGLATGAGMGKDELTVE